MKTRKRRRLYHGRRKLILPSRWELRAKRWLPLAAGMVLVGLVFLWRWGGVENLGQGLVVGFTLGVMTANLIEYERLKKQPRPKIRARKYLPARRPDDPFLVRFYRWWEELSRPAQTALHALLGAAIVGVLWTVLSGNLFAFIAGGLIGAVIGVLLYVADRRQSTTC